MLVSSDNDWRAELELNRETKSKVVRSVESRRSCHASAAACTQLMFERCSVFTVAWPPFGVDNRAYVRRCECGKNTNVNNSSSAANEMEMN